MLLCKFHLNNICRCIHVRVYVNINLDFFSLHIYKYRDIFNHVCTYTYRTNIKILNEDRINRVLAPSCLTHHTLIPTLVPENFIYKDRWLAWAVVGQLEFYKILHSNKYLN